MTKTLPLPPPGARVPLAHVFDRAMQDGMTPVRVCCAPTPWASWPDVYARKNAPPGLADGALGCTETERNGPNTTTLTSPQTLSRTEHERTH